MEVTLYKNGFTLDKGPFRPYEEPQNKQFMNEMNASRVPAEIMEKYKNRDPKLPRPSFGFKVGDKREKDYRPPTPPPQPKYVSFSGAG